MNEIKQIRNKELKSLRNSGLWASGFVFSFGFAPILVSAKRWRTPWSYSITLYHTKILSLFTDPLFSLQRNWRRIVEKMDSLEVLIGQKKGKTQTQDLRRIRPCTNGRDIVGCYMLCPFEHPVACYCAKFKTRQTFEPTTPNISFIARSPKYGSVAQQCWIRLHSSSNIVGATHANYTLSPKSYSFPRCTAGPNIVGSLKSDPFARQFQCWHNNSQDNTQQCWEMLRPFARSVLMGVLKLKWHLSHVQRT